MRFKSPIALALVVAVLCGCASTRARVVEYRDRIQRQEAAERIVERTITVPEVSYVTVEKIVALPKSLTSPCGITYRSSKKVGEYIRVAETNTPYLEDCRKRMAEIDKLQREAEAREEQKKEKAPD